MSGEPTDRLYFLPKDPHWSFLWWNVSRNTLDGIAAQTGGVAAGAPLWIRVHDVTGLDFDGWNSHSHFDVEVRDVTGHWYLALPIPNRTYCAEAGFVLSDGGFLPAVRSNRMSVPPDGPSANFDRRWSMIAMPEFGE